ncbi:MAG: hypothetical protein IJA77_02235 [Clostridia bacterium]|nr:hypothetical protein [Clostridia bacterium]
MKKLLSCLLLAALLLGCTAALAEAAPATIIDFADGNYAFLGVDTVAGNADACELSVVDYNGGKALRVDVKSKVPYVALNIEGLLGENYVKLAKMTFDVGAELGSDGKFYAQSGKVYTVTGEDQTKNGYDWSVFLKNKNPKAATVKITSPLTAGIGEYMLITKETDTFVDSGRFAGEEARDIYLSNLQFFDAEGNVLPLDLTAVWESPNAEADLSNLSVLTGAVDFPGFTCEAGGWSQSGFSMPEEFRAALVPGSVIEISFESGNGTMWLVFPDSAAGWKRIGNNNQSSINNSKNIAQVTYEQIAAVLGEDTSTWGDRLQCEAGDSWKVYSVKVGQAQPRVALTGVVEFEGFTCEGGGWSQSGFNFTQEVLDALQPGTALEISFESDNNTMWIVLPDSAAGWKRIGNNGAATIIGNKAYITYEQIVEIVGEDKAGWGARLQCEGGADWKVYAVNVGKVNKLSGVSGIVNFEGFTTSGNGWSQSGFEMTEEIKAALVPGSVVTISYESEADNIWLVFPDSAAGWKRIQSQTADTDGKIAQITFEEIAEVLGEDVSAWGARMQCESSGVWNVYSVTVGQAH